MKKLVAILLMAIMLFGISTGCQKTPESPIVVGKDQDVMIEKAKEEPQSIPEPEKQNIKMQFDKGNLHVKVDAEAIILDADMPIVRIKGVDFTQEQVDAFWDVLVADTPMYQKGEPQLLPMPRCPLPRRRHSRSVQARLSAHRSSRPCTRRSA